MKATFVLGVAATALLAACSPPHTNIRIKCPNVDVIMSDDLAAQIRAQTGDANFGTDVCKAVEAIDAMSYTQPTAVTVIMPSGSSYQVRLQVPQP